MRLKAGVLFFTGFMLGGTCLAAVNGISANHSQGAVVIGYTSAACATGLTGALRYNSAVGLQYCNSSAWTSFP